MSDAAGGGPEEVRRGLVEPSAHDEVLRRRSLEDPEGTMEQELGAKLPEGIEVRAIATGPTGGERDE